MTKSSLDGPRVPTRWPKGALWMSKMGLGRTLWAQNAALGMPFGRQWARIRTLRGHLGTIMAAKIHISAALGSTLGAH